MKNWKLLLFLCVAACICINDSSAQSANNWEANWIWQEADGPANTWMCFRKNFSLKKLPETAPTRIAADSKYWLWINGQLVVFEGQLKNSLKENTYYDIVDIAPYLQKGKNVIAIQVWHFGKDGFSHRNSGKGGLLFESEIGKEKIISDNTWKQTVHPAYGQSTGGGQPNMRMAESNIVFDAQKERIAGWQQLEFDDKSWKRTVIKGRPPVSPWNHMIERPFAQWKDFGLKSYLNQQDLLGQSTERGVTGDMPYDARVSAYLKVNAPAGKKINIKTDQYDGWKDFGEGPALRAEYVTKSGVQEFETLMWMSGNQVIYEIPEGVEILDLQYRELGFPTEFAGQFSCSDPFYETLWDMARRTLYINMYDDFMDCPDRERALWWGDVVNQSGEVYYTLDPDAHGLVRKAIAGLIDWQRPDSTLFSPPSKKWSAELPQQMLASIGYYGFWNYYLNTNDAETIIKAYPAVRKYLAIWKMDDRGLVAHRRGAWDWGDWGENIDISILDNAWYYLALKAAIPMAEMSGFPEDTATYRDQMESIEANFSRVFWDNEHQYFISDQLKQPDDRANAMAIVAGLIRPEQFPGVVSVLEQYQFASPYMEKYVLEALCLAQEEEKALTRMKSRYTEMVESEYNTLWEVWSGLEEGTINHGWNAPNTVLSQYIAGISPVSPGWKEYQILPQLGQLTEVSQTVSTVSGLINMQLQVTSDDRLLMRVESPLGTTARVGVPRVQNWSRVRVLPHPVNDADISAQLAGLKDSGLDERYFYFTISGGVWTFEALK